MLGRILVVDTLLNRGIMVKSLSCHLCLGETKTVNHVLINCHTVVIARDWVLKWCCIPSRQFCDVSKFVDYATNRGNCPRKMKIITVIFYCLL